jgi:hypothetical protein
MRESAGDIFTHPADHVAAVVLLVLVILAVFFVLRTILRVRSAWRASGISLPTVKGWMSMRSMATQMSPEVQKLVADAIARGGGQGVESPADRIANLEQLHAQGQLTDAKLAELKEQIQKEVPTAAAGAPTAFAVSPTAMVDALRKTGFLTEDALTKISAAMSASGVSAAHSTIASSAMAPDVPGVPDQPEVIMRKAQQARLAMIDDLHSRHVIDDAQLAAARAQIDPQPEPPASGPPS